MLQAGSAYDIMKYAAIGRDNADGARGSGILPLCRDQKLNNCDIKRMDIGHVDHQRSA